MPGFPVCVVRLTFSLKSFTLQGNVDLIFRVKSLPFFASHLFCHFLSFRHICQMLWFTYKVAIVYVVEIEEWDTNYFHTTSVSYQIFFKWTDWWFHAFTFPMEKNYIWMLAVPGQRTRVEPLPIVLTLCSEILCRWQGFSYLAKAKTRWCLIVAWCPWESRLFSVLTFGMIFNRSLKTDIPT